MTEWHRSREERKRVWSQVCGREKEYMGLGSVCERERDTSIKINACRE